MFIRTIFLLISFSILTGCATHIPMNRQEQQSIKTVYVNPTIKKPNNTYEFRSGYEFGPIGGIVRTIVDAHDGENVSMKDLANKNNIDISEIVYQTWKTQLTQQTPYKLANKSSEPILSSEVKMYGISIPHGYATNYVPVLVIESKLIKNNKVIWQAKESVLPMADGMPSYEIEQIFQDPKKLEIMWKKAADKIVTAMISDMKK